MVEDPSLILSKTPVAQHQDYICNNALSKLISNLHATGNNINIHKYDGFKDFTRDVQINWRALKMQNSDKATAFKTTSDIVVSEYPMSSSYNAEEVNQCKAAIESIASRMEQID